MIYHDIYQERPPMHYECVVLKQDRNSSIEQLKKTAFRYMDQLEGWCSHEKGSILIDLIFLLEPQVLVEIGVFGGKSLVPMAVALKEIGKGKIFGIDPWDAAESAEGMDGVNLTWWSKVDHKKILKGLQTKIEKFSLSDQIELIIATSEQAEPISNIDLLHIDGNHSEKASYIDVTKWVPLVRKGGLIVFDDMSWGTNQAAVDWLDENCIRFAEFREACEWGIWVKPFNEQP